MSWDELQQEIAFGSENLANVFRNIERFSQTSADEPLRTSALTYECVGYYHAIEHLIIRILKHRRREIPSGAFSHRDTLRSFRSVLLDLRIEGEETMRTIENLMAFRHVATKIYGFMIDREKLEVVVTDIRSRHAQIIELFQAAVTALRQ
jgi:hypothetical protein